MIEIENNFYFSFPYDTDCIACSFKEKECQC
jgi:hypothetical protein